MKKLPHREPMHHASNTRVGDYSSTMPTNGGTMRQIQEHDSYASRNSRVGPGEYQGADQMPHRGPGKAGMRKC